MRFEDEKALANIEDYGCHILHVLEEKNLPRFSYSIGIEKCQGHPEIVLTGLKQILAHWIINEYNSRIRTGESLEAHKFYSGFLDNFEVTFRAVEEKHYTEYFCWAVWLYQGTHFRVLQLIYPTMSGAWPWNPEAPHDYTWSLPKLDAT